MNRLSSLAGALAVTILLLFAGKNLGSNEPQTAVTEAGLQELRKPFPNLKIKK